MKPEPQSKAQERMLRLLCAVPVTTSRERASVLHALMRRSLASYWEWGKGACVATDAGKQWVREHPEVRE